MASKTAWVSSFYSWKMFWFVPMTHSSSKGSWDELSHWWEALCTSKSALAKPPDLKKNMIPDQLKRNRSVIFCSRWPKVWSLDNSPTLPWAVVMLSTFHSRCFISHVLIGCILCVACYLRMPCWTREAAAHSLEVLLSQEIINMQMHIS